VCFVGVTRPNLDPNGDYAVRESTDAWFIKLDSFTSIQAGSLWGNGEGNDDEAGDFDEGGLVGVLLHLDEGSLCFFKNGVQHGPDYPAGSVTGPVVYAVQMYCTQTSFRLLPHDAAHALVLPGNTTASKAAVP
jgi:hypothetical protein